MLRGIIALIGAAGLFIYTLVDYVDYANTPEKEPDVERVLSLESSWKMSRSKMATIWFSQRFTPFGWTHW
jgi:hypothetical protein